MKSNSCQLNCIFSHRYSLAHIYSNQLIFQQMKNEIISYAFEIPFHLKINILLEISKRYLLLTCIQIEFLAGKKIKFYSIKIVTGNIALWHTTVIHRQFTIGLLLVQLTYVNTISCQVIWTEIFIVELHLVDHNRRQCY